MLGMLLTFRLETCSLFLEALRHAPCWCWGRCWSNFLFVGSKSDGSKPARVWKTISGLARAAKHRQVSSQKVLQQMSNVTFGFSSEKKLDTVQQHPLRAPLLGQNTQVAFLGGACWSRACGRGGLWVGHFLFSALGWFAYPTGLLFVSAGWLICSFDLFEQVWVLPSKFEVSSSFDASHSQNQRHPESKLLGVSQAPRGKMHFRVQVLRLHFLQARNGKNCTTTVAKSSRLRSSNFYGL